MIRAGFYFGGRKADTGRIDSTGKGKLQPIVAMMLMVIAIAAAIVSVCLIVHLAGILLMAEWLLQRREFLERNASRRHFAVLIVMLFAGIMFLHLIQTGLWAVFYYAQGLFSDFETSLYFSMVSFTTIGYGDVLLPRRWRLLGVIEGFSGVFLCGISAAFMFAVINALFQFRLRRRAILPPVRTDSY